MKQIMIDGILISLERKRIKNMYLRILPPEGRVSVSAPMRMKEEEIERFIKSKLEWIRLQQDKMKNRNTLQEQEYVTGEKIYLWGRAYPLVVKETTGRKRIMVTGEEVLLFIQNQSTSEQRKKLLHAWYKKALEQEIPFLLEKWEKRIGVKANSFSIRDMKTRWGTCHIQKKAICLNLQLAKKSPICLEYVLVHELVHLLEKSHNHVFKGYMDQFLPNWRSIKTELNGAPSAYP